MNEYREFQKSQRTRKEQLESSLKSELKQLELKHRQEQQDMKTVHQRMRTNLAHEMTREREQRALDRLNKSLRVVQSCHADNKSDESNEARPKRKRSNKKPREEVSSDNDDNDADADADDENESTIEIERASKKRKITTFGSSLDNEQRDEHIELSDDVEASKNKQDTNVENTIDTTTTTTRTTTTTTNTLQSKIEQSQEQQSIPSSTQLDRTLILCPSISQDQHINENDNVISVQKQGEDSFVVLDE